MPIYEYECPACRTTFEKKHSINDITDKQCDHCGADLIKKISNPSVKFIGKGFFCNDYPKEK